MSNLLVDTNNSEFAAAPGSSQGTLVGRNTTTPVGFFGAVPGTQPTFSVSTGTLTTLTQALASVGLIQLTA